MYLRILEDKKKFTYHKASIEEKKKITTIIKQALSKRKEILVAVIFGSFTNSNTFRDIDIAVFTGYTIPYNKVEEYQETLAKELEKQLKIPVDITVIDYAPPWIKAKTLKGTTIIEKQQALTTRLRFKAIQEIKDIKTKTTKQATKQNPKQKLAKNKN